MEKHIKQSIKQATVAGAIMALTACGQHAPKAVKKESPAKVAGAIKESDITTVTLTPLAEKRLGITLEKAVTRPLAKTLNIGGEVVAIPGSEALLTAPGAGMVLGGSRSQAGRAVKKGDVLLKLALLPTDKDGVGAREDLLAKQAIFETVKAKADRAAQLLPNKGVSQKEHEEAQAELAKAKAALAAAQGRVGILDARAGATHSEGLSTITLTAPFNGVVLRQLVAPGQFVTASAPMLHLAKKNQLWVKAPVYSGDLEKVNRKESAFIQPLGTESNAKPFKVKAVQGPPLSDAQSVSSDVYYEIANGDGQFRIGQKVGVLLPLKAASDSLAVPYASVVYDIQGGSWVYVKTASQVYKRTRVAIERVTQGYAVVTRGLKPGSEVVVNGAAEVFGTEFGVGK